MVQFNTVYLPRLAVARMPSSALGEFFGTLILILLGNGVVAGVLLKESKANGGGWIVITAGWGIAVLSGAAVATVAYFRLRARPR